MKREPLVVFLSDSSDSLNMKYNWLYLLYTSKTFHRRTYLRPDPSFFRFIKNMMNNSPKVSYTEHLLSSSSSYKKQRGTHEVWQGKKLKEWVKFDWKFYWQLFAVALEHGTYLYFVSQLGNPFASWVKTISMSHYSPLSLSKNALFIVALCFGPKIPSSQMLPSHVLCLTMFKGSLSHNHYIVSIIHLVSVCIYFGLLHQITLLYKFRVDDGGLIMDLLWWVSSCQLQHII